MSEPSLELQKAVLTKLTSTLAVTSLVGQRVYDRIPTSAPFPYIRIGTDKTRGEIYDGAGDDAAVDFQIDVFSRNQGKVETKNICGAVKRTLHEADLALGSGYSLLSLLHDETTYVDDPDGLSTHGVIIFHALINAGA